MGNQLVGGLGGAMSPQWGAEAKPLKADKISTH